MTNPMTRDFSRKTRNALTRKGISIIDVGLADVYAMSRTYTVNDKGTCKVWSHAQVLQAAN